MSTEQIRQKLTPVFPPDQANALAQVFEEIRREQVTRMDFTELKEIVRELAISQNELAGAQQRTEQRIEELAAAQQRTEQRVEELAAAQQHTEFSLRNLARQVGGLSEALGANLEDLACDIVPELLEKHWGFVTESVTPEEIELATGVYPFDLVVRGTISQRPVIVLGETKSNVTCSEVEKFAKLVAAYRRQFPEEDVRMLFFGFRAESAAKKRIAELNACMVFSRGVLFPPPE